MSNEFVDLIGGANETNRQQGLPEGQYVVAVRNLALRKSRNKGRFIELQFTVVKSSNSDVLEGDRFGDVFFFELGENAESAAGRVRSLTRAIAALPASATKEEIGAALSELVSDEQPGRGVQIRATATAGVSKKGNAFVGTRYEEIRQTPEQIRDMRAWLEEIPGSSALREAQQTTPQVPPPVKKGSILDRIRG